MAARPARDCWWCDADQVFQASGRLYWLGPTRRSVLAFDGTTLSTAFAPAAVGSPDNRSRRTAGATGVRVAAGVLGGTGGAFVQVIAGGASVLPRQFVTHPRVARRARDVSQATSAPSTGSRSTPCRARDVRDRRHERRPAQDSRAIVDRRPACHRRRARVLRARHRRGPPPGAVDHRWNTRGDAACGANR